MQLWRKYWRYCGTLAHNRDDIQHGILTAAVVNSAAFRKGKSHKPIDFMPYYSADIHDGEKDIHDLVRYIQREKSRLRGKRG